jgi:uncharacterized membrane protein
MHWDRLRQRAADSLWFTPGLGVAIACVLAIAALLVDRGLADRELILETGPEGVRETLSTVTSAMLNFTVLVFSITVLVLQLASNQFTPRVLRTFVRQRVTKRAMATFVGTFVYAVIVLSQVRSDDYGFVPLISSWLALALVLVSVGVFIHYIHAMAHSIRVVKIIDTVADETRAAIDRMFPEEVGEPVPELARPEHAPDLVVVNRARPGVVVSVEADRLVAKARSHDAVIEVVPRIGDFVPCGAPLFHVWGELPGDELREHVALDIERTMQQDPAYGIRQLVDIAVRALSPSLNDPTTAVQVIDQLHDLLRRLSQRQLPARTRADGDGALRLIVDRPDFGEYVRLALEEIRHHGASSVQVVRRTREALADCIRIAPPERRFVLREELGLLEREQRRAA